MNPCAPGDFFDLSSFAHAALFSRCEYVWEVLSHIETYLAEQKLGKIEISVDPRVYLIDAHLISIGKGTVIEPGAYIKGPCIIGENCTIRHGAYIRGQAVIGDKCVIGHDTEVKSSIFLNRAQAAHFAYVGNTVLGNEVNLGAGTKCANLKFDHSTVFVTISGGRRDTQLKKFGAIIGDGTQIGCNSVTNPGTLIGKNVFCYPCLNLSGCIPEQHRVKSTQTISIIPL